MTVAGPPRFSFAGLFPCDSRAQDSSCPGSQHFSWPVDGDSPRPRAFFFSLPPHLFLKPVSGPDSSVGAVHLAPGDFPSGKKRDVLTVEFTVVGIPCLGLNGGPAFGTIGSLNGNPE